MKTHYDKFLIRTLSLYIIYYQRKQFLLVYHSFVLNCWKKIRCTNTFLTHSKSLLKNYYKNMKYERNEYRNFDYYDIM